MNRLVKYGASAIILASITPINGKSSTNDVFGYWLTENKKAIIEIMQCGQELCGHMVWMKNPVDTEGSPKRDPNGSPLCGIQIVEGFRQNETNKWNDGDIYNPRDGKTYSGNITLIDGNKLEVRGYVSLPIFGKSQVWTRTYSNRGGCEQIGPRF